MADDVLDHDDRVVDQDADREDQREEADPVDRVAHQPGSEEREEDSGRDDDEDDDAFAPPDRKGDEHDDREGCQREMEEQLIGLFGGGLAVVAGHRYRDVIGNQPALHRLEPLRGAGRRR